MSLQKEYIFQGNIAHKMTLKEEKRQYKKYNTSDSIENKCTRTFSLANLNSSVCEQDLRKGTKWCCMIFLPFEDGIQT